MTREQFGQLSFTATMFMSLTNGGHAQSYSCKEVPDFFMNKVKEDRKSAWRRTFIYKGIEYVDKEKVYEAMKEIELNA